MSKKQALRQQLPAVNAAAFLNTGTCGPIPTVTADVITDVTEAEYSRGRASTSRFMQMMEDKIAVREGFAALFHTEADNIALTHHTTDGMNIATLGFNWAAGDEVLTTTLEHEAGLYPLYIVQSRYGVNINYADVGLGADPVDAIAAAITPKTRLLSISHVSYSAGARFPLEDIIPLAHEHGIPVLVDGAQSAGVFDLDLPALGVDFYAVPGQKWLCGPEGVGALYVRPDRLESLHPTFTGYFSIEEQDWQGGFSLMPGAKRFETGMMYPATIAGMRTSLEWFHETVNSAWAYDQIAALSSYTRAALEAIDGVRVITPAARQASLVNFVPVGWSPARMAGLVGALEERGFIIRSIPHEPFCMRVSCGFYNTEAEIDGLRDALAELLLAGPEAMPVPEWGAMRGLPDTPVM